MSELKELKAYPLSDEDIKHLLGDDISILVYPELQTMNSINECFDKRNRCVILFPTNSATSGHWCAMIRKPKGIEFFDSYGNAPDHGQRVGMGKALLDELDMDKPFLTRLMKESGAPISYNTHDFQSKKHDVATCGRHAAVRCLYYPRSLDEYKAIVDRSGMSADSFVTGVTFSLIGK